ncbi:S41 family peptidase [Streptomyces sp. NPDC007088]|uniref:S41 family peptidase n=1 Tax=Streptomyces sp. NPDC007088 TaxID=3364773 RepID=UPI0036C3EC31
MPDSDAFPRSRSTRSGGRGAALPLLFAGVLAAGVCGGWPPQTAVAGPPDPEAAAARPARPAPPTGSLEGRGTDPAPVSRGGARWDAVYDPAGWSAYRRSLEGAYTGVGLSVAHDAGGALRVRRLRGGGPADRAGLRAGDRLLAVAGRTTAGRPVTEVVALLRGGPGASPGSPVTVRVARAGREHTVRLRRATVTTPPVTVHPLGAEAVRIKVSAFTKGSGARLREAVAEVPHGTGIALDLRGNPGGLVTEAADAAGAFLDGGLVATYEAHGAQRALYADRPDPGEPGPDARRPVVALVDAGTMSAAELLTGALQDRGRAVVVGERTFGKGSVQQPEPLPDGGAAERTVGHWRTPAGRDVDGTGLVPDVPGGDEQARTVLSGLGHPS